MTDEQKMFDEITEAEAEFCLTLINSRGMVVLVATEETCCKLLRLGVDGIKLYCYAKDMFKPEPYMHVGHEDSESICIKDLNKWDSMEVECFHPDDNLSIEWEDIYG